MPHETSRLALDRIARPIVEELGVTEVWDVVGDQATSEYYFKVWRDPVVQILLDQEKSDAEIAQDIRAALT
jgi:hypothetical protein